ncbi:MAG TPA: lytic transglycosylase domain-containing protein [Acidimicrobiales bacterium]|nr:lytic transglycosylase domain-containing protein [Acidimicrobiales bacterium]
MRRALCAALCAAAVLAGCSENGEPAAVGQSAPATTTTAPAPTTTVAATTTTTATPQAALASTLVEAETAIRNPATPASRLPELGQAQQQAYRQLVAHPEWEDEVLGLVPERLRATVRANLAAGRELSALTPAPPPDAPLPKWRIVPPEPAETLLPLYKAAGAAAGGVPWEYLAAIHLVETRMGRIKGDSSAGAQGPMQFIPSTWAIYGQGGDVTSNRDAIHAAARYLRATGAPSDMARALRAYNNSARYVRAITHYAEQMVADERAYLGYHAWQVYYGTRLLPEGTVIE